MIIDELFEAPQQCPECGGISFSNLILAEKKDACYHKVKASAKVWPSAYASGRLVQCRKKGAANYGNKSEGVMEMDKSQTPPGRDGSNDPDAGKKEYTAKATTPEKVAKHGEKILNKIFNKKKGVAEEYELAGVGVAYELGRRAYQERKTIRDNPYSATREARKHDEWEKGLERGKHDANDAKLFRRSVGEQGMAENAVQPLSVQQLATISDAALDNAYGYGRSTPGNTFGWQANLKSAAYAKQMIDQGVTDIEAISDAIHKGWNTTAQAFVQNPKQFDDTAKLAAAGKLEAKLQQRAQLMKQNYGQLPEEEKEKDRVVARALLQAIRGPQQPGSNGQPSVEEGYVPINIYKGPTNPAPKPKKVEPEHAYVDNQVETEKHYQAREKYFYNVVGKFDRKVINPEPIKGLRAAEEFMKQNGLGLGNADIEEISTLRFHATGIDASGKRVVSEPLTDMKDVRNFYKQHGIDQFASTTDLTTTDDGSVTEGQLELNTPDPVVVVQDLKGKILDKINLSVAAQKYKLGPPQNIKTQLAHQNYTKVGNYMIVSPMSGQPQDATTQGVAKTALDEKSVSQAQFRTMAGAAHNPAFARKVGISQDVAQEFNQADKKSNYKKLPARATEGEQQPGADYRDPPEDKDPDQYGDDYQAMVARVKTLAGLGPMKTVYDPARRQYRNMPTAVQPKK